jgi:hypothetical protein
MERGVIKVGYNRVGKGKGLECGRRRHWRKGFIGISRASLTMINGGECMQ